MNLVGITLIGSPLGIVANSSTKSKSSALVVAKSSNAYPNFDKIPSLRLRAYINLAGI
jgi:hypothetical protein